ncbi:hypothetical protein EUGRSUZ_J00437 [Eucalyptus grandis]|uniref:Uncharacterized protein n=2 Tax=Eucalyptus grandis TaxID=71139 RepID=A0A059A9I5_EUCGR|nr:hypothetical protein EUGRSUZ_J00437 [Eucalyptus grandis]
MIGGADPNSTNGHASPHHVVTVAPELAAPEPMHDWSSIWHRMLSQKPTHLKQSAGNSSCCIFRVPATLKELNPKAYKPRIVSIGPYHHGNECVKMIEEHKPRFFTALVARTRSSGVDFNHYFTAIALREKEIRDCYSEPLNFGSAKLIEMMVLDGCFIIEVLRVIDEIIPREHDDPLFNMYWTFTAFIRDFLYLENQIPFFVLQTLYDMSKLPNEPPCVEVALRFFNYAVQRPPEDLEKCYGVSDFKHLLHLMQLTLSDLPEEVPQESDPEYLQLVPSVTKLRRAGIKFKPRKCNGWLGIRFTDGVLEIPPLTIDDLASSFFLNCVAFEQCYCYCPQHITSYVTFIGCLMPTADDASFLSDRQVLENYCGTHADVASFFNDLGKDVDFDISNCYLAGVMEDLNRYYRTRWRVNWTGFKRKYFGTPWYLISAVAACLGLMLAFIQSFFALYGYLLPPKQ